jgi:hypothetical protein
MLNIDGPIAIAISTHFNGEDMMVKSHALYCTALEFIFSTLIGSLIVFE